MKKVIVGMMVILMGLLLMVPMANAYPVINVGDTATFKDGPGSTSGGEFKMSINGSYVYQTFCVETGEFLNFTDNFTVNAFETPALGTAALFWHFIKGDLTGYDYGGGTANVTAADNLQQAIWYFQGQSGGVNNSYVTLANSYIAAGFTNYGQVVILDMKNLAGGNAQDVLAVTNAVPIPAAVWLLGSGLLGLVGIRRRFKK